MTCFPTQTPLFDQYNQTDFHYTSHNNSMDYEMGPLTAQFILFTSLQKLDQAKRSRGGIRLRRGLLIAVTALKAKQLLWQQQDHYAQLKSLPRSQTQPLSVSTMDSLYCLPTIPVRNDEQTVVDETKNDFYSCPIGKKMDYDHMDYSVSQCVSGSPCFPPPSDELLRDDGDEDHSFYQPTFDESPSKRLRLDLIAEPCNFPIEDHSRTHPNAPFDSVAHSSCIEIG